MVLGLQLLSALKHLHKRSLVHRDVSARNCYLAVSSSNSSHLRLGDPALSRDLFPNDYHCLGHNENRPVGEVGYLCEGWKGGMDPDCFVMRFF